MLKQIDRVIADMKNQVAVSNKRYSKPTPVGIVGINCDTSKLAVLMRLKPVQPRPLSGIILGCRPLCRHPKIERVRDSGRVFKIA